MNIEKTIQEVKKWTQSNNFNLFFGIVDNRNIPLVLCDTEVTEIIDFLESAKGNGAKIIILNKGVFWKANLLSELGISEAESDGKVKSQIKKLNKFEGQADYLSISWLNDNVMYEYLLFSDWVDEVEGVKEKIIELNEISGVSEFSRYNKKGLPKNKIMQIANELAKHKDFFKYQWSPKLDVILKNVVETLENKKVEINYFDRTDILTEARSIFEKKYLKLREKEITEEIAKLKNEGLPKVAIQAKLEITGSMLNKYYY